MGLVGFLGVHSGVGQTHLLQLIQHQKRVLVDWCVESIHELSASDANLREDALNVLFYGFHAGVNSSDDLVSSIDLLIDIEVGIGHIDFNVWGY